MRRAWVLFAVSLAACSGDSATSDPTASAPSVVVTTVEVTPSTEFIPDGGPVPSDVVGPFSLYQRVPAPPVPLVTDPVIEPLPDGTYWVLYLGGSEVSVEVTVVQVFWAGECERKAAELGTECVNDYLVVAEPSLDVRLSATSDALLSVAEGGGPTFNYAVTAEELAGLRSGAASTDAPSGYSYVDFPFVMQVADGQVTHLEQFWLP